MLAQRSTNAEQPSGPIHPTQPNRSRGSPRDRLGHRVGSGRTRPLRLGGRSPSRGSTSAETTRLGPCLRSSSRCGCVRRSAQANRNDVLMTGCTAVHLVHQADFFVQLRGVRQDFDLQCVSSSITGTSARALGRSLGEQHCATRLGKTSGGFNLVVKRCEIGRGMNTPCAVGQHPEGHAEFLSGNRFLKGTVPHGDGGFGQGDHPDFCIACTERLCGIKVLFEPFLGRDNGPSSGGVRRFVWLP